MNSEKNSSGQDEQGAWKRKDGRTMTIQDCVIALTAAISFLEKERITNPKIKDDVVNAKNYSDYVETLEFVRRAYYDVQEAMRQQRIQEAVRKRRRFPREH